MFIFQSSKKDCGFASLKMLLANTRKERRYLYLKNEKADYYSFRELIDIASNYGVTLDAFNISDDYDLSNEKGNFLALIYLNNEKHLVYVKKITKKRVLVYDPEFGKRWEKMNVFKEHFARIIMKISELKSFTLAKTKTDKIIRTRDKVGLLVLQVLSIAGIITSLNFVAFGFEDIFSVAVLTVCLLLQIIYDIVLKKSMQRFDLKFLKNLNNVDKEKRMDAFRLFQEEKRNVFRNPIYVISTLIIVGFLIFTFVQNGPIYLIFAIALLAIGSLLTYLTNLSIDKKKVEIMSQEEKIKNSDDFDYTKLVSSTYSFSSLLNLKNVGLVFLALFGSYLLMKVCEISQVNFMLYYFCTYFFMMERTVSLLDFVHNRKEIQKTKIAFYDTFK